MIQIQPSRFAHPKPLVLWHRGLFPLFTLLLAAAGLESSFAETAAKKKTNSEVHLIGIYEGFEQAGQQRRASVQVDRPGKEVTLVLTSYESTAWQVTASKNTIIGEVILGGYEGQAVEGVDKSTLVTKAWRRKSENPISFAYSPKGHRFRQLVKELYGITKSELSSFHGSYRAEPDDPFVVDSVEENALFAHDYPRPTPTSELPADARNISFSAHRYAQVNMRGREGRHRFGGMGSASFGKYDLSGAVAKSLKPLPKGVKRITYDPNSEKHFGIIGNRFARIDMASKAVEQIAFDSDLGKLSWPCDVTYDSKRKRVILGTSSGGGFLYAFSPETEKWSLISKRPGGMDAFVYSAADDFIYGLILSHTGDGNVASLAKLNAEGALVGTLALPPPFYPGSLGGGPGVAPLQIAVVGKYVTVVASPSEHVDEECIYLIDPSTKKAWLTSKVEPGEW